MGFHTDKAANVFREYQSKIDSGKQQYKELISDLQNQGKKIAGYGASATSTTLMYHYNMAGTLEYLFDDFEAKHYLFSPGMHIPVFPSKEIYTRKPDYIVLLAWRYHEKIIKRHQKFIDEGGHFIIPLPEIRIV